MHCIIWFVLYGLFYMHCLICIVLYELWSVHHSMNYVQCIVFYTMYSMHCLLCIVLYALYSMYYIICIVFYAVYSIQCILLDFFYALYSNIFILCIAFYVFWTNFETCCWMTDGRTDRKTDGRTDRQTDRRTLSCIELLSQLKILHWNNDTFRDETLKSQHLVGVNQAGISVFPNLRWQDSGRLPLTNEYEVIFHLQLHFRLSFICKTIEVVFHL
jgi:hypothetical protein